MHIDIKLDGKSVELTERELRVLRAMFGERDRLRAKGDGGYSVHWRTEHKVERITLKWDYFQIA